MKWKFLAVACSVLAISQVTLFAGEGDYTYGECWWQEYIYHENTVTLLHFGPPQREKSGDLAERIKEQEEEKREEEEMLSADAEEDVDIAGEIGMDPDETLDKGPQIDPAKIDEDEAQDYAKEDRQFPLPEGMRKVEGGRFGDGLECSGGEGLKIETGSPKSVELSFKVEELPEETSCLWSVADDEARLLLHPDGSLEFKLKKPHGNPGKNPNIGSEMSQEDIERIKKQDAEIRSDAGAVASGRWVHARVYRHPHPTPGGGSPWDARLLIDGELVSNYMSERYNMYRFFGSRETEIVLGNSSEGDQGFEGVIDEFRLLDKRREFYEHADIPWRDAGHDLQFGKPWFRGDSVVFHAPLGEEMEYAINEAGVDDPTRIENVDRDDLDSILARGIRGYGWKALPQIGFPRLSIEGMDPRRGTLEFWMRPLNWDDCTSHWGQNPPPHKDLTVARFYGRDRRDGEVKQFMSIRLPRAHNREKPRIPLDPGHWTHVVATWNEKNLNWGSARVQSVGAGAHGRKMSRNKKLVEHVEPLYVEFGTPDDVSVKWGQEPGMIVDEVVGYDRPLAGDEREQAFKRWKKEVDPIQLYGDELEFKWSLQRLNYTWWPRLPEGESADEVTIGFEKKTDDGWVSAGEEKTRELDGDKVKVTLNDGPELEEALYRFTFVARDDNDQVVVEGARKWDYSLAEWREYDGGVLDTPPDPWTDIEVDGDSISTRMSTFQLRNDGLPEEIIAGGENLLAERVRLYEGNQVMEGKDYSMKTTDPTEVRWASEFSGDSADVRMDCTMEYDGMLKYELDIVPQGDEVDKIRLDIPIKDAHAKRMLYYPMGARGVKTGKIGRNAKQILNSRIDPVPGRGFKKAKKDNPDLSWSDYRAQLLENRESYGFYGHVDVNDLNRGLFWFADNAAGWHQSREKGAIELVRDDNQRVILRLNLVAEPVDYDYEEPIVFAVIPHPAKPMPEKYRLYERVSREKDAKASSVFDAFRPWPKNPRSGMMETFPRNRSWEYAESCIPSMKSSKPHGYRTMYLSLKWLSCRTGAYDNWEWRSGENGAIALTPSLINYLCWEMNEWIERDIFDAVYLDEAYEEKLRNLEAGMSVELPNGSEQPGVDNFQFRELMKRWYGLFVQNGKTPMLLAHNTLSFQYPGLLYTQAFLDGENHPIVSLKSGDWIEKTSKQRFEVIQNGHMWGITPFYMPYISEGGFGSEKDQYKVWQWRMARQAQSMFAHYEVGTVYEGQGKGVYDNYWNDVLDWGGGDPEEVPFHPYWKNDRYVTADGQGEDVLVSFYRKPDSILLVVSNRKKEERDIEVQLDTEALGLETPITVRDVDSGFEPPEGEDYQRDWKEQEDGPQAVLEEDEGEDEEDLEGAEELFGEEEEGSPMGPEVEGEVLVIPVRERDFRLLEIVD